MLLFYKSDFFNESGLSSRISYESSQNQVKLMLVIVNRVEQTCNYFVSDDGICAVYSFMKNHESFQSFKAALC